MHCSANELKKECLTFTHILNAPLHEVWRLWEESPMVVDFKNMKNNKTKIIIKKSYTRNEKPRNNISEQSLIAKTGSPN